MLKGLINQITVVSLKPLEQRRYLPVRLVATVGSILTVLASATMYRGEFYRLQAQFSRQADYLELSLQRRLDEYYQVTVALGALFNASSQVSDQDFQRFSEPFLERYPGIRGMAWLKMIAGSERQAYEAEMRLRVGANFTIVDRNDQQQFVPAGDRNLYFPITYGEPKTVYQNIFGFDHGTATNYQTALWEAIETKEIVMTQKVKLADQSAGVAFYHPVYRLNTSLNTPEERRQNLLGLAYTIYQISDLVKEAFENIELNQVDLYLLDKTAPKSQQVLLQYSSKTRQFTEGLTQESVPEPQEITLCGGVEICEHQIEIAGQTWTLIIVPNRNFPILYWGTIATFIIGSLVTLTLVTYLSLSVKRTEELKAAMKQLKKTQTQLIQSEKMSSLGQLVAGIAHEINNPVSFIYGNLTHAHAYTDDLLTLIQTYEQEYPHPSTSILETRETIDLDFLKQDLPKLLGSIESGAQRIQKIVESLRSFSRMDEADLKLIDIHQGLESTLIILQNRLEPQGTNIQPIQVVRNYANLPLVECYAGELNQVFMNLIVNAIDALEQQQHSQQKGESPRIVITTELVDSSQWISVKIQDNGSGIAPEVMENLYNPFFTTKPVGKGTGLGLSIAYAIVVEKHHGELKCKSEVNVGTEFQVLIPLAQTAPQISELSTTQATTSEVLIVK